MNYEDWYTIDSIWINSKSLGWRLKWFKLISIDSTQFREIPCYDSNNFELIQMWLDSKIHEMIHPKYETFGDTIHDYVNWFKGLEWRFSMKKWYARHLRTHTTQWGKDL